MSPITDVRSGKLYYGSTAHVILPEAPTDLARFKGYVVTDGIREVYCTGIVIENGIGLAVTWLASAYIQTHYMDCMHRAKGFGGLVHDPIEGNEMILQFPTLRDATRFVHAYGGAEDFQLRTDVSGWGRIISPVTVAYSTHQG